MVIVSGQAEFVNGSRLVYPVPKGAMNGANMLGNKFFSVAFTYLLGQRVKDTLCGTKVLWRSDWERIRPMLGSWGTEDRWGDYELLFGAAKLNLKILDLPVHYQERIYGSTKMTKVFRNGLVMLRMCWHGFLEAKAGLLIGLRIRSSGCWPIYCTRFRDRIHLNIFWCKSALPKKSNTDVFSHNTGQGRFGIGKVRPENFAGLGE